MRDSAVPNLQPPALACACFLLGLVLTPFAYIAIGALGGFSGAFSAIALPLLLAGGGFLLARFLRRSTPAAPRRGMALAEAAGWLPVGAFLFFVSNFTLLTTFERIGLFCTLFLACSLVSLPVLLLRRPALLARAQAWPAPRAWAGALAVGGASAALASAYVLSANSFL
ncbi:hypothetical protein ACAN107058_15420 [Paracidovorax anthurii]|uniref:Uncharacterized protein n=1 Tax=Paracidovorax anthurii TaxID=78229 RepID=A0A328ZA80_9BURK|nr:hypothetical protein AX018_101616 [Paracidovorax anthurii]